MPKGIYKHKKGYRHSEETKRKISLSEKGKIVSLETRLKISRAVKGRKLSEHTKSKMSQSKKGSKSYQWIFDRSKLAKRQERNDMAYKEWRKEVWSRDDFKCKIFNKDCKGRIEAHHILGWRSHPELRYQINNGITLCHAHHPRKRSDEAKLSPYFQKLVAEIK